MALTVSESGTHLERDGELVPFVIDTIWAAFCDVSEDDWRVYLRLRRRQGFTGVIVTALPIVHDRTEGRNSRYPYARHADGSFDWTQPNEAYFEAAREYVRIAREDFDMEVIVAVLWNNYLPGTWGSRLPPYVVMPDDVRRAFVERVADLLGPLDVVFAAGGDDGYDSPEANVAHHETIDILRERAPQCLVTTHAAPKPYTPDDLLDRLDLHLLQSGHDVANQNQAWSEAVRFATHEPRRPVINIEPPYEWHGMVDSVAKNGIGRWSPVDMRTADWASVLSGAGAGIGYAAHGVWMWNTVGGEFLFAHQSMEPATWVEAMTFPGVHDVALIGHLIQAKDLDRLEAAEHLLPDVPDERFRAGATPDGDLVALYFPYDRPILVADDLSARSLEAWDLGVRAPIRVELERVEGGTWVRPMGVQQDAVVFAERRS